MDKALITDLQFIIERRSPEEWKALAAKLKSQPPKKPELNLFDVHGAAAHYLKGPKAAYGAVSKGLTTAGTKAASTVGFSPATAAKVGAAAGSPTGVAVAGGLAAGATAAAIYAAYKIYRNYISQAGRACKGNPNKNKCILQYYLKGKQAQLNSLTNSEHKCKERECYKKLDAKILQTKREIDTLKSRIGKA